jgi:nucleotide-binding universal stress UspA family protein
MAFRVKKILVAEELPLSGKTNQSRAQAVRRAGSWMAEACGARLELLHAEDVDPSYFRSLQDLPLFREKEMRLQQEARGLKPPASARVVPGLAESVLLDAMKGPQAPDLAVLGTHGRTGFERMLLGSVAEEVIRRAARPVMVVGPGAQRRAGKLEVRRKKKDLKILLATDMEKASRKAEEFAVGMARKFKAALTCFSYLAMPMIPSLPDGAFGSMAAYPVPMDLTAAKAARKKELEKKAMRWKAAGMSVRALADDRGLSAAEAILGEASKGYGLVVLGTHGRSLLGSAFLGSTARQVILQAAVPVVVVRG